MGVVEEFSVRIRRKETPFYEALYRGAKKIRQFEVPVLPLLHRLLWHEREVRSSLLATIMRIFYYTPVFKTRCAKVGRGLFLVGGLPGVTGHLRLEIGDHVTIHGVSLFNGAKVFDAPTLKIGNNTHLGYQVGITVGRDVIIGDNVLIGNAVNIMSYDGHPSNPETRHLPAPKESSRPIVIKDNVWIGARSTILKGVTIGEGSVIATGSVVTSRVPPNSMAIGNPARIFPLM